MAIKILVVDDEPDVAVIFRQKFRRRVAAGELEFAFAENGRLALEALQRDQEISLVFTDIRMPSMDGLTFLKEIKALDRKVLLSVVVSAYDDMVNIREAMRLGAWDFVTKPIDLDDLEHVLNQSIAEVQAKWAAERSQLDWIHAEQARLVAIESKRLQQDFFENLTHEFRTPLTLILAPLESALGLSSEQQVLDYLGQAKRAGHILMDLVNQLLDFAKIEATELQAIHRPTNISQLGLELCAAFEPLAQQKRIKFHYEIETELAGLTDKQMLGRILLNLLSNAFKYSPIEGNIICILRQEKSNFLAMLEDSGKGFSDTETESNRLRFQSENVGLSSPDSGTGLGLHLSHRLAELLGGRIRIEKSELGGAKMVVELPMTRIDLSELENQETKFSYSVPEPSFTWHSNSDADISRAEKPSLLLAEDHPDMQRYLIQILKEEFDITAVSNGKAALEKARETIPDLILSDWMMPEMSGQLLLENIRLDKDTQHIPFVLLTAKSESTAKLIGIERGSSAFLAKPFLPNELRATLHNLLDQRERLRERFRAEILRPDKYEGASMEDQFIADVKRVMESHLKDEQFGVEQMADHLAMSRRTLVRKLSALTGQAPVKFIRSYRLERALAMLQDHSAPIWEIAVKTGFGSASYFTKCFKDHYGKPPRAAGHAE